MSSNNTMVMTVRLPNEAKEKLDMELNLGHSKIRDVMMDLVDKLNKGEIFFCDGRIEIQREQNTGLDLSKLLEACDDKGVKPQDAINRTAQMIWRG